MQQLWLFQLQGVNNRHHGSDRWEKKKKRWKITARAWFDFTSDVFFGGGLILVEQGWNKETFLSRLSQLYLPLAVQPPMRQTCCNSELNKPLKNPLKATKFIQTKPWSLTVVGRKRKKKLQRYKVKTDTSSSFSRQDPETGTTRRNKPHKRSY